MNTEKWQVELRESIVGTIFARARKNARGPWIIEPDKLPPHVARYIALRSAPATWEQPGTPSRVCDCTIEDAIRACAHVYRSPALSFVGRFDDVGCGMDARMYRAAARRDAFYRSKRGKRVLDVIRTLGDLARYVDANDDGTEEQVIKSIACRLSKDTECGIGFSGNGRFVSVAGYCEGTDAECASDEIAFPFTGREFDRMVKAADRAGIDLWNETHGCEACNEGMGHGPINPDCTSCHGEGVIL